MALAVTDQVTTHTTSAPGSAQPELLQTRESLERMRVRVNAYHAHHDSLDRAAHGIRTIHDRLARILEIDLARHGWTPENRLAASALEAARAQLRSVLEADRILPVEKQRACLNHALSRTSEAADLHDAGR